MSMPSPEPSPFPRQPPSGIRVLIVGAGFAGLTAAIECHRKGHSVTLLERSPALRPLGDIISFGQNAGRVFARWGPAVTDRLAPLLHRATELNYYDWRGTHVTTQSFRGEDEAGWGPRVNGHRAELHAVLFDHARERGVDVRLGEDVVEYFETDAEAGVVVVSSSASTNGAGSTESTRRLTADVVLAAEGVRSRAREMVLGRADRPRPSGYAIWRAWFPVPEHLRQDPAVARGALLLDAPPSARRDAHAGWIGRDVHFLAATVKGGRELSWVCTHRDDADIEGDSWQVHGRVEDVLRVVGVDEGWDPAVAALVRATPADRLFDHKLVFRDPLPTFISPRARVALLGDAAHPFLPTSIQGASQAVEDGVTVAACLDAAAARRRRREGPGLDGDDGDNKDRDDDDDDMVTEAVRVYERIRYERVHAVQATGVTTREQWHGADWDAIWADPTLLHLKREEWILRHDAESHAYAVYDEVRESLGAAGACAQTWAAMPQQDDAMQPQSVVA